MLLIVAASLLIGFTPAPFLVPKRPDSSQEQLKKLQGEWVRTRWNVSGEEYQVTPVTISSSGKRMTLTLARLPPDRWTIRLDASKSPKVFDIEGTTPGVKGVVFVGIYRLEGDTLTLCSRWSKAEKDRPTDFDAKPHVWLEVFQRRQP
jgi:uncharacterized protein (TIGR03067 family)